MKRLRGCRHEDTVSGSSIHICNAKIRALIIAARKFRTTESEIASQFLQCTGVLKILRPDDVVPAGADLCIIKLQKEVGQYSLWQHLGKVEPLGEPGEQKRVVVRVVYSEQIDEPGL